MADANGTKQPPTERIHAIVHGFVQGVNYRAYTVREATRLGLVGWVRNRRDGTVETVVEGSREQLEDFIAFLHIGPPSASVRDVAVTWQEASGDIDSFVVRF